MHVQKLNGRFQADAGSRPALVRTWCRCASCDRQCNEQAHSPSDKLPLAQAESRRSSQSDSSSRGDAQTPARSTSTTEWGNAGQSAQWQQYALLSRPNRGRWCNRARFPSPARSFGAPVKPSPFRSFRRPQVAMESCNPIPVFHKDWHRRHSVQSQCAGPAGLPVGPACYTCNGVNSRLVPTGRSKPRASGTPGPQRGVSRPELHSHSALAGGSGGSLFRPRAMSACASGWETP